MCERCAAQVPAVRASADERRKLWQLPVKHHCVLLGAAFDIRELRQLFRRAGSTNYRAATDYELHSSAVHFARERNALTGPIQKLLDERFRDTVLRFRDAISSEDLVRRWRAFAARGEAVAAYWAALTHPACDPATDEALSQEMHMAAHDLFAERRASARRARDLNSRVAQLEAQLASARGQASSLRQAKARLAEQAAAAEGRLAEARAERDAAHAALAAWEQGEALQALRAQVAALQAEVAAGAQALRAERSALRVAQRAARRRAPESPEALPQPVPQAAPEADLGQRRVLCIGGKTSLVPQYRAVVERARGEFVHHDGGVEHHLARLPALLGAVDAVVCLAADCSHGAYRLAKRYCKAKGKPCALLGNSSVTALTNCIDKLPANREAARHAA